MAKLTLLAMTQNIISDLNGNPVNSIDDTEESGQIAEIIKTTYYNIITQRDWSWLRSLTAFDGLADVTNPTKMKMPELVAKVLWAKYNGEDVVYLDPKSFHDLIAGRDTSLSNVDANGYRTDIDPTYWTTYDDEYVYFDSYDSSVDTTLQTSKSVVFAATTPGWTASDAFIPDLPEKLFPMLLASAKASAFNILKQTSMPSVEAFAGRALIRAQNEQWRAKDAEAKVSDINYGRK